MINTPNLHGIAQGIVKVATALGRASTAASRAAEKNYEKPRSWQDYLAYPINAGVAALKSGYSAADNAARGIADTGISSAAHLASGALNAFGATQAAENARKLGEFKKRDADVRMRRAADSAIQSARHAVNSASPVAPAVITAARNAVR